MTRELWLKHYNDVRETVKPTVNWMYLRRKMMCEVCGKIEAMCGPCDVKYICPCREDYSVRICTCVKCLSLPNDRMIEMRKTTEPRLLSFIKDVRMRRRRKVLVDDGQYLWGIGKVPESVTENGGEAEDELNGVE